MANNSWKITWVDKLRWHLNLTHRTSFMHGQLRQKSKKLHTHTQKWLLLYAPNSSQNELWLYNIYTKKAICKYISFQACKQTKQNATWLWGDVGGFEKWCIPSHFLTVNGVTCQHVLWRDPIPVVVCHFFSCRQQQGVSYKANTAIAHVWWPIIHLMWTCVNSKAQLGGRWRTGVNVWCKLCFVCLCVYACFI